MIIELGEMAKTATEAFIKSLYAIVLLVSKEGKTSSKISEDLKKWATQATPFVDKYKLTTFMSVCKEVYKNEIDEATLVALGKRIRIVFPAIEKERDINYDQLNLIKAGAKWLRIRSQGAYKRMESLVSTLNEPQLTSEFIKSIGSQKPIVQNLRKVVKKLTGQDGTLIPSELGPKLKAKNKEVYREYLRLRRDYTRVWRDALKTYVRKSGKDKVDYQTVLKFLASKDIENTLPRGFEGLIDDQGRIYTKDGKLIDGVPTPVLPNIEMNPEYDAKEDNNFVFKAKKADGTGSVYKYTVDYVKKTRNTKFESVGDLRTKIKDMRAKWLPMVKGGVKNLNGVVATILEMLLEFSARVGTKGNATEGQPTFGISTLRLKNLHPQGSGNIVISYKGKAGVLQKHTLEKSDPIQKFVIQNIDQLIRGKKPSDQVFTFTKPSGKVIQMNNVLINKLFRAVGGGSLTIKSLRTLRGTVLFEEQMKEALKKKKPKNDKEAKDQFMKIAEVVGQQLGHIRNMKGTAKITGATAIGSYIDPSIMLQYWKIVGMRPPKFLAKFEGASMMRRVL